MAVLLLAPIVSLAVFYLQSSHSNAQQVAVKIRGNELSQFLESAQLDLSRFMGISSRNALIALVKYEEDYNASVSDAACVLHSLSYYGNATNDSCAGVALSANISNPTNDSYLRHWLNRTIAFGNKFGFNTSISLQNQSLNQSGGFNLNYSMVMLVNSTEKSGLMNVSRSIPVSINISLLGLDDPLFLAKTSGIIRRRINTTSALQGAENLSALVNSKYYAQSDFGPSFLDRLEGSLFLSGKYGNDAGIETFVYGPELEAAGFAVKNQSSADYDYFNESLAFGAGCNVDELSCGEFWWFKLNSTLAAKYGVALNCTKCP